MNCLLSFLLCPGCLSLIGALFWEAETCCLLLLKMLLIEQEVLLLA